MRRDSYCQQLFNLIVRFRLDEYGPKSREFAYFRCLLESNKLSDSQAFGILHINAEYFEERRLFPDPTRYPTNEDLYADGRPDIETGTIRSTDLRVGFNVDPPRHSLVIGETGTGKSAHLRQQIIALDAWSRQNNGKISFLVFDGKNDFTDIPALGSNWRHFNHAENLHIGFNAPSRVRNIREWTSQICEILAAHLNLIASVPVLFSVLSWALAHLNGEGSRIEHWPSLSLVVDILKRSPPGLWGGKREYDETLINRCGGIALASGPLLDNESGLDVERDLLSEGLSAVINVTNLKPADSRWILTAIILAQVLFSRLESGFKTDQTDLVIVIDEADTLISSESDAAYVDGLSIVGQLLKQCRELGITVLLGATVLAKISPFVLEDVSRFEVFNQGKEKWEAARMLGLPQGMDDFLGTLKRGEHVMRQSLTAWPYPMRVIADYVPPNRTPKSTPYDSHPFNPARRLQSLPNIQAALSKLIMELNIQTARRAQLHQKGISQVASSMLRLAAARPYTPIARLWDSLGGATPLKQIAVRKELEGERLMEFAEKRIGSTNMLLAKVTEKGWKSLGNTSPLPYRGRGGIVHVHFANWLAMVGKLRKHNVDLEWQVTGTSHTVDTVWFEGESIQVFEVVVTSLDNVLQHIDACLRQSNAIASVTIVTPQKSMCEKIEQSIRSDLLASSLLDRVRFEPITGYLKELWP